MLTEAEVNEALLLLLAEGRIVTWINEDGEIMYATAPDGSS